MKSNLMKAHIYVLLACIVLLIAGGTAMAGDPMIAKGNQELGLSGNLDFDGPSGGVNFDILGRYGMFLSDFLEAGGFVDLAREEGRRDVTRFGVGAFAEQHLALAVDPRLFPYAGADLGMLFADISSRNDKAAVVFTPRVGVKWFLRDDAAIDANLYWNLATDDIYINNGKLESTNWAMALGLRVYF